MALNLVIDRMVQGRIYPALAQFHAEPYTAEWRQFGDHWPNTIPLRLQEYFEIHGPGITVFDLQDQVPANTYYAIAFSWFNFDIDYISLIPHRILDRLRQAQIKILFYYHEGDNPSRIKTRLDHLIAQHHLPIGCYVFVSSNSAADALENFVSFQDSELWYWHRNRDTMALPIHDRPRLREFTALNRLHKMWRAAVMADLLHHGVLSNSYWSYCESDNGLDPIDQCPIALEEIEGLACRTRDFLLDTPYYTDQLSQHQRNDHSFTIEHFHTDSYCNIVIETMFDYDQSGGVFLSEKTFKPIKHGQMFFVAGAAGSLDVLRDMGYKTFDHVLDNSYDTEIDNTKRWLRLRSAIKRAQTQGLAGLFSMAHKDIEHNQQLFCQRKNHRLSTLLQKIHDKSR